MKRHLFSSCLLLAGTICTVGNAHSAPTTSTTTDIIDAADALLAGGRPIKFDCGKSAGFTFTVDATTVVSRTVDMGQLSAGDCADWKKNRDTICKEKIGEVTEDDKKKAQENAQKKCNDSIKAKLAGLNIQCNESSRNSCSNPDECSPFRDSSTKPYSCPLPDLDGTSEIKADYFEFGYEENMTCTLKCHLTFGAKAIKDIKLPAGCEKCEQGAN